MKNIKNIILSIIIILLTGGSGSYLKSKMVQGLYHKANPNASKYRDQIMIKETPQDCINLDTWCDSKLGRYIQRGNPQHSDFYCVCYY